MNNRNSHAKQPAPESGRSRGWLTLGIAFMVMLATAATAQSTGDEEAEAAFTEASRDNDVLVNMNVQVTSAGDVHPVNYTTFHAWVHELSGDESAEAANDYLVQFDPDEAVMVPELFLDENLDLLGEQQLLANLGPIEDSIEIVENLIGLKDPSGLVDGRVITCKGATFTVMGWEDTINTAGSTKSFHGAASSRMTIVYDTGKEELLGAEGYVRSLMDNMEFLMNDEGKPIVYWDWLHIPMLGDLSLGFSCVYNIFTGNGLLLSVSVDAEGTPLGIPTAGLLSVSAGGTLCMVPC